MMSYQIMQNPPANILKIDGSAGGALTDVVVLVVEPGVSSRPARLEALVETATAYANAASSENTRSAYAKNWRHFTAWCRREGFEPLPPSSQVIGLYIGTCASGEPRCGVPPLSVATIERRLSGIAWNFTQRGVPMDRYAVCLAKPYRWKPGYGHWVPWGAKLTEINHMLDFFRGVIPLLEVIARYGLRGNDGAYAIIRKKTEKAADSFFQNVRAVNYVVGKRAVDVQRVNVIKNCNLHDCFQTCLANHFMWSKST